MTVADVAALASGSLAVLIVSDAQPGEVCLFEVANDPSSVHFAGKLPPQPARDCALVPVKPLWHALHELCCHS